MTQLFMPQSVSVQIHDNNPSAGVLVLLERADSPRRFDVPMTRRELEQLRDQIARELAK